jgi:diketogulonate reductase-like aldo/keto reductase
MSRRRSCSQITDTTGVSNVSVAFLEDLLKIATVIPAVNQIERHP